MISAHLPAGTKIECVDRNYQPVKPSSLFVGTIYTVDGYTEVGGTIYVYLAEITFCAENGLRVAYSRDRFNQIVELPASIRECLNVKELVE